MTLTEVVNFPHQKMRIIEVCVPYSFLAHVSLDSLGSMPNKVLGCCHSVLPNSFLTTWTIAHQALLSIGFPRQEDCSGLPFPSPGDFHDPRIKPMSPALAGRFFTTVPPGKPLHMISYLLLTILSSRSTWPHFISEEIEAPGVTCPKSLS